MELTDIWHGKTASVRQSVSGHPYCVNILKSKTKLHQNSYIPSTSQLWNHRYLKGNQNDVIFPGGKTAISAAAQELHKRTYYKSNRYPYCVLSFQCDSWFFNPAFKSEGYRTLINFKYAATSSKSNPCNAPCCAGVHTRLSKQYPSSRSKYQIPAQLEDQHV